MQGSSKSAPVDEEVPDFLVDEDKSDGRTDQAEENAGEETGTAGDGGEDADKKEEDEEDEEDDKKMCDLFPWEHSEVVVRELLNCFDVRTVVHYNTNCSWPLACARHARHFVGFARSQAHAQHIRKTLVAMVVAEIIEGTQDGFFVRRFLSAQRSIGGSQEGDPKNEDAETEDGQAGAKTDPAGSTADTASSKVSAKDEESPASSSDED